MVEPLQPDPDKGDPALNLSNQTRTKVILLWISPTRLGQRWSCFEPLQPHYDKGDPGLNLSNQIPS